MIRETIFYKIISAVHIVFFASMLCFGTILLSGTLLMLPALSAGFRVGRDAVYKELDINDSIIRTYFRYLKPTLGLLRFFPVNIVFYINVAGMLIAAGYGIMPCSVASLVIAAFMLTYMFYIAGFYTFVDMKVSALDAAVSMIIKPQLLLPVFIVMILFIFFFSPALLTVLFFSGAVFIYVIELVIFIQLLYYKKALGKLDKDDAYAHLVIPKRD